MLCNNNVKVDRVRFLGGVYNSLPNAFMRGGLAPWNAFAFGQNTSYPQGYNNEHAVKMPLHTNGNIFAVLVGRGILTPDLKAIGNIEASLSGAGSVVANANMAANRTATLAGVGTLTPGLYAKGWMSATIDIAARPTAFDIAQAIWNAEKTQYNIPGSMGEGVNDAGSAGNPWAANVADNNTPGTFGWFVQKLLTVAKFLGLK